jgi:DUF4097 and DUF4098 domain-containing protein YvlB
LLVLRRAGVVTVHVEGVPLDVAAGSGRFVVPPSADVEVVVPSGVIAHTDARSGDVSVEGAFAGCDLATTVGRASAKGVRGDVKLRTESGSVTAEDCTCDVMDAQTSVGAIRIVRPQASRVGARSRSGDVSVESGGRATYSLSNGVGAVRVRGGTGSVVAHTESGPVEVEEFQGAVNASTRVGLVHVAGVLSSVDAETASGSVEVDAAAGSTAQEPWSLRSNVGHLTLRLPVPFSCSLEATADLGTVTCSHPSAGEISRPSPHSLKSTFGDGGARVGLRTTTGSVTVEKTAR